MPDISGATVLVRSERAAWQDVAGEFVILDVEGRMLRGLNASAGRVWMLLDGTRSLAQVAHELAVHYRIAEARALEDVLSLARQLCDRGLLEAAPPPTSP